MLKREIRVLGLDISRPSKGRALAVCVVFRGRLWLDGVFTCSLQLGTDDVALKIAQAVRKSKQYSQLHAVIVSENSGLRSEFNIAKLAQRVKLPTIQISTRSRGKKSGTGNDRVLVNGKYLFVRAKGIRVDDTIELLSIASRPESRLPEALRVAKLITNQVSLKRNSPRWP